MKCENCPAGWENRSYEGECNDCGCQIYGHGIFNDNCKLTRSEIEKRLKQLGHYEAGMIERPKWVAERFLREADSEYKFLVSYPPKRMTKGVYYPLYGEISLHYQSVCDKRHGAEEMKNKILMYLADIELTYSPGWGGKSQGDEKLYEFVKGLSENIEGMPTP